MNFSRTVSRPTKDPPLGAAHQGAQGLKSAISSNATLSHPPKSAKEPATSETEGIGHRLVPVRDSKDQKRGAPGLSSASIGR